MKIRIPSGVPSCRVGCLVRTTFPDFYWFDNTDPIWLLIRDCVMDLGYMPITDLTDSFDYPGSPSQTLEFDRHAPIEGEYNGNTDYRRYGSLFNSVHMFAATLGIVPAFTGTTIRKEHEVRHVKSLGMLRLKDTDTSLYHSTLYTVTPLGGFLMPNNYEFDMPNLGPFHDNPDGFVLEPNGTYGVTGAGSPGGLFPLLDKRLEEIQSYIPFGGLYMLGSNPVFSTIPEFSVSKGDGWVTISYRGRVEIYEIGNGAPLWAWSHKNEIRLRWFPAPRGVLTSQVVGETRSIRDLGYVRFSIDSTLLANDGRVAYSSSYFNHSLPIGEKRSAFIDSSRFMLTSYPEKQINLTSKPILVGNLESRGPSLRFHQRIEDRMSQIRPACYNSTISALDSLADVISLSLVEDLRHLQELSDLVPDFRALASLPNLPLSEIQEGARIVGGEYLRTIFGIIPTVRLMGALPLLYRVMGTLANLEHRGLNLYGSFHHTFEGEFGVKGKTQLTVRTKVSLNTIPGPELTVLLNLHQLGIVPTPTVLWKNVPFSFVVDWFLNISGRLHAIESLSLLAACNISHFTHTYSFTAPIEKEWLDETGTEAESFNGVSVKYFVRELSLVLPSPSITGYDFFLPTKPPPWAASLALVIGST